ncbi:MAG: PH domain-containing protein [Gemmataceae bacterium]
MSPRPSSNSSGEPRRPARRPYNKPVPGWSHFRGALQPEPDTRPVFHGACSFLIAAFGVGLLILLFWYIKTRATALSVTDHELLYEKGILSKERLAVSLRHVRSVQVNQGFINRILGVGTIEIKTAGDEPEFTVTDLPDPHEVREAISRAQEMRLDDD